MRKRYLDMQSSPLFSNIPANQKQKRGMNTRRLWTRELTKSKNG
jgi:hypothetical protein